MHKPGSVYSRREFYFYASNMHFSFPKCDIGVAVEDEVDPEKEENVFRVKPEVPGPTQHAFNL